MATELLTSAWEPENFFETTLSADCTDSDTDIFLTGVPTNTEGTLIIDPQSATNREIIYYSSKTATKVTCPVNGRGYDNTTAVPHLSGTKVIMAPIADWFNTLKTLFTTTPAGWTNEPELPDTITYNGNRSYDLVFNSTDLTDTLSEGMRLRLTRTVSAQTQCTDLESSSSQYWNDTSVSGMSFTDDFVAGAWVKLESYTSPGTIISRYNGTSGWILDINSDGTIRLTGFNAGGANFTRVGSYQSIPLGRWVHVAVQLDMSTAGVSSTTSYVMIDGVDVPCVKTSGGTNPTALIQAGNLEIGSNNGGTQLFDGKIAQAFVSSAKITQANVRTLISQGLTASLISTHSIVSAYSFDGNANDLNTTNANNLTAQGSAVATNVDSPFGNYLGGTLEYAIISAKPTFSTNTTVTVQVPEGCAIPTSGGISAVSYSTNKVPYDFPANEGRWIVEAITRTQNIYTPTINQFTSTDRRLEVPVGSWRVGHNSPLFAGDSTATNTRVFITLSTSTSTVAPGSEEDTAMTGQLASAYTTGTTFSTWNVSKYVVLSAKTTYYKLFARNATTVGGAGLDGDNQLDNIYAIPAYL